LRSSGCTATLDDVVIFLPLVLLVLVFGVLGGGGSNVVVLLPMVLMLGAGAVFVGIAMRDGRPPPNPSVRQLPTDHLRRKMYLALRPHRSRRQQGRDETAD
jgi:hypothetical protein